MWLYLALLSALMAAVSDTVRKRLVRELDPYVASALTHGIAAVTLVPVVLAAGVEVTSPRYLLALAVSGVINVAAAVMVARSVQLSDLSLVAPLQGTTPVFTLAVGTVVLDEFPSLLGVAGVLTITGGTYVLAAGRRGRGIVEPLRALWRDRGARLMLLVAFLWGTSVTFDKIGVLASTPLVWSVSIQIVIAGMTGLRVASSDWRRKQVRALPRKLWLLSGVTGVTMAVMFIAQMTAYVTGLAGYVIAVKRISILLSVLAGGVLFREGDLRARLAGSAVILAGLLMLAMG